MDGSMNISGHRGDGIYRPKQRSNIPSLVSAFMASLTTGGTTYAFGLYSDALKKSLHLSQSQLDTISTAFFFAGMFSWIPGMAADKLGGRFGLCLGGIMGAVSLTSYWLVARQFIQVPQPMLVTTLSILGIFIFLSNATITGSVFKIIVASTGAGTKGTAVGIAKGYVGLGAGAYACIFESIRRPGSSDLDFLVMAAFFSITCGTISGLILLPRKEQIECDKIVDHATKLHFRALYISLSSMACLIAGNSVMKVFDDRNWHGSSERASGPHYGFLFLLITFWLGPIMALLYLPRENRSLGADFLDDDSVEVAELEEENRRSQVEKYADGLDEINTNDTVEKEDGRKTEEEAVRLLEEDEGDVQGEDIELNGERNLRCTQMLTTPSALLMLWSTTILVGAGTVVTNNMGQMVESLGFSKSVTPASLALFSVAQAAARVGTGTVSESALNWNVHRCCIDTGVPRPFFLFIASLVAFLAHSILGIAEREVMFVFGIAVAGAAFGMVWPLMVLIVGEVFGTENVGANYLFFDGFSSAIGTFFLSKVVAQMVYEDHIDQDAEDRLTCLGTGCFRATHIIVAILSLSCALSSLGMQYKSRDIYNKSSLHHA